MNKKVLKIKLCDFSDYTLADLENLFGIVITQNLDYIDHLREMYEDLVVEYMELGYGSNFYIASSEPLNSNVLKYIKDAFNNNNFYDIEVLEVDEYGILRPKETITKYYLSNLDRTDFDLTINDALAEEDSFAGFVVSEEVDWLEQTLTELGFRVLATEKLERVNI